MKIALTVMMALAFLAAADQPPTIDQATQNKLLKAQHTKDLAQNKMATLTSQWNQLQAQQRDLQAQAKTVEAETAEANKAYEAEIDAAFKAANVDKEKFTLDPEKLAFVPKTIPAPPTPTPEKK